MKLEEPKKHIDVTHDVRQKIKNLDILLPSHYAKLYSQEAALHNITLKPEELLDFDLLSEKVVHHVVSLSACTQRAIEAIECEDKIQLKAILIETKALHSEIEELRQIVYEDALTKSHNRKCFEDNYLCAEMHCMKKDGILAIVDLNKFKDINDNYGHIIGDKVLIHVAKTLKETGADIVRYGGDEFLLMFSASESSLDIRYRIEDMIERFNKISFKFEKKSFKVNFAYGISPFEKKSSANNIIDLVDKEMYAHKKSESAL